VLSFADSSHFLLLLPLEAGRISMKAALQLGFVIFYVTSASAVAQLRTSWAIQEIQHTAASVANTLKIDQESYKDGDNLPRYREAKKMSKEFQQPPVWNIGLSQPAKPQILVASDWRQHLHFRLPPSHSRAPPLSA
jgi:hypothetical protein